MDIQLANRVQRVKPSPTLAVTARAAELRAAGQDIIGLGAGEPDFDTPEHIKAAAIEAINKGQTKYTPVDGTPALKKAIQAKFKRDNSLHYELNEILVSSGAKHSLYNLMSALLNPGDEVVIPAPYWVSYPDMALLADGVPVILEAGQDQHFKITPEQLEAAITDKTRAFVINSPSNPTGTAYSRAELAALGEVLAKHPQVVVISDDIYEHIVWNDEGFLNIVNAAPALKERTVVVNGVSKGYSMTGWRIGYAAGPAKLIGAMKKIQSQSTSNPCSIAQAASVAALDGDQGVIAPMLKAFKERHDYVVDRLNDMQGVNCLSADGTFYAFPNVQGAIDALDGVEDDVSLAEYLISEAGVALVPGSAFGLPGHARISYATSMENLEKAMDRLKKVFG
ncbi:pyridoxal phosphate-dependent aminotransferase [Alkalilimnicola sp. S0819]|uniref:pyridoxal phosphate-dependent aminotransferase n=1 Tax=Alkalilimnicola sp. S0819 TaxID=2613922 RepID=UPI0012625E90|nr:pyridoxal phosphate-dependent aminotransferase [Alkalilimnicola sp. S0819]KAB7623651.1 pyridoxal phosphate-dependent aminotransferase [Alkalilimnicola sp. S0819]MPQ16775.1 aminotransferase class I/II-fold pyridoxal phosphate-dependent enzyme [Alkalilimnicola sp. S0819]